MAGSVGAPSVHKGFGEWLGFLSFIGVFAYFYAELLGCGFDPFPGFGAFAFSDALDLIKTGDGVSYVGGVVDGFFAFFRESKMFARDVISGGFFDLRHAT